MTTTRSTTDLVDTPSTSRAAGSPAGLRRPSLARLTRVELRKSYDTRAGRWLLVTIVALTVAVEVALLFAGEESDLTFDNFFGLALFVQAVLIPILGILLITSEWSQRTGLVTFTLEPVRARIVVAKVAAALVLTFASLMVACAVGALMTAIADRPDGWDVSVTDFGEYGLVQLVNVGLGLAFGMVLINSAAAIVAFFVLPTLFSVVFEWKAVRAAREWLDFNQATTPIGNHDMGSADWAHLAVAAGIWIVVPMAIGVRRLLRAEVK